MRKARLLRSYLLLAVPALAADPTRLALYVDKGRVLARATGTLSFEYRYTLSLTIMDHSGDVDALTVPLLAWIADHEPELLDRGQHEPFTFEVEVLDGDMVDVAIELDLSERVRVERGPGGKVSLTHLPEPARDGGFPGAEGATLLRAIGADLVAGDAVEVASA